MKILILKPSSLGDVVQALPVLRLLKRRDPSSEIYWWLSQDLLPLLEADPDLHGIFPFDRRCWTFPRGWRKQFEIVQQMRRHRFDWVIDLQGLARSGMFAWLAGGEITVGLDDPREGAHGFYDVVVPRPTFHTHAIDWYLEVLRALQVPVDWNFTWLPVREDAAVGVQRRWRPVPGRWITLNPGARWLTKRWPVEYFQQLVRLLTTHDADVRVAILGSRDEMVLGKAIAEVNPQRCLDLTGQTSMAEMVEWIRFGDLMVCNDTGPMHIAAALGKPIVAIFGPTEPRRTGPYRQIDQTIRIELPCAPCFRSTCANSKTLQCLLEVAPLMVFEQIRKRLAQPGGFLSKQHPSAQEIPT